MAEYLLFGTERYALPILQPLADALQEAGHGVHAWFVDGAKDAALRGGVRPVAHARAAVALRPRAVFSAANWVPTFVSGAVAMSCAIPSQERAVSAAVCWTAAAGGRPCAAR